MPPESFREAKLMLKEIIARLEI